MSTLAPAVAVAGTAPTPRQFPRPGLGRLTMIEVRKASDTRAGGWLLALTAFATIAVALVRVLTGGAADHQLKDILEIALIPSSIVLPVLGILLVTGEWSQRTALATFALVPDRSRVVRAKILAALGLGMASLLVALLVSAVVTVFGGAPDAWSIKATGLGQATLAMLLSVLWGLAFGLVLSAPAAAIVAYFTLPTLFSVLGELVTSLDSTWEWIDPNRALTALGELNAHGSDWAHLAVSCTLWIALPLAIGVHRLLRREVK
jgi:ABC-2 type transport system permease protein